MSPPRIATSVSEQLLAPWSSDALIAEVYSLAGEKELSTCWTSVLSTKLRIELPNGDSDLSSYLQEASKQSLITCVTALRTELEASTSGRSRRKPHRKRPPITKQTTSQEKRQAREKSKKRLKMTGKRAKCPPKLAQPRQRMDIEIHTVDEQETSIEHIKEEILAMQHVQQYKFTSLEAQLGDVKRGTEVYQQRLLEEMKITQENFGSAAITLQSNPTIQALAGGEFRNICRRVEEQALAMHQNNEQLREAQQLINEYRDEIKYLQIQLDKVQEDIRQGCVERRASVNSADSFSEAKSEGEKVTVPTLSVESTRLHGSYPLETSRPQCIAESSSIPTSSPRTLAGMSQTSKWREDNMASSEPDAVNAQYTPMLAETQQVHERLLSDIELGDCFHYTIDSDAVAGFRMH
ncbi:uncharacterized protein PV06_11898 [Exophiala oligosperma]|uniref:Uncharacterized protein n=1 Tax=Exophiala oligosperma TaxID=215243 RepID=A0A0D2BE31_9EURO|nr:uncharacterized protein PV06_11898 [Exophiala oligosperma]KIW35762.1 hypothetical protein PV06_11898 [Exophiala oligosperma]